MPPSVYHSPARCPPPRGGALAAHRSHAPSLCPVSPRHMRRGMPPQLAAHSEDNQCCASRQQPTVCARRWACGSRLSCMSEVACPPFCGIHISLDTTITGQDDLGLGWWAVTVCCALTRQNRYSVESICAPPRRRLWPDRHTTVTSPSPPMSRGWRTAFRLFRQNSSDASTSLFPWHSAPLVVH